MLGCLLLWTCATAAAPQPPASAPVTRSGLEEPHIDAPHIDELRVDKATGQVTLFAVPEERIVSRAAADRLRRKLNGYARYARSGQALRDVPGADIGRPPALGVKVAAPVSSVERQNLEGIRLQYRYTDIRFTIEIAGTNAAPAAGAP